MCWKCPAAPLNIRILTNGHVVPNAGEIYVNVGIRCGANTTIFLSLSHHLHSKFPVNLYQVIVFVVLDGQIYRRDLISNLLLASSKPFFLSRPAMH